MRRCFRLMAMLIMLLFIGFVAVGCGSGGGDDSTSAGGSPDPIEGSKWDSMVWDQGQWG